MRYMLLVYSRESEMERLSPEEDQRIRAGHWAVMDQTAKQGIFRGAEPLKPTATATTVRIQNGKPLITDGPFAETKEQLAGYYILDCKDLDEAIAWAEKSLRRAKAAQDALKSGQSCRSRSQERRNLPRPDPYRAGSAAKGEWPNRARHRALPRNLESGSGTVERGMLARRTDRRKRPWNTCC
jgi:hypothetical protein